MRFVRYLAVMFLGLQFSGFAQRDEDVYSQVGAIKGQVIIVNHPTLGRTPASGDYFVLQRTDCPQCVVGVRTDIEGRYTVLVGIGTYRVIYLDLEGEEKNVLRAGQEHEVTVQSAADYTQFDLEVEVRRQE